MQRFASASFVCLLITREHDAKLALEYRESKELLSPKHICKNKKKKIKIWSNQTIRENLKREKSKLKFLPELFVFIKIFPITMPVTGHDNESKQRKYHSQSPQSQRPSLQQILPLPSPCNRRDTEPRRRRLVLHVSRRRIHSGLELWWLHSFFLLHFWHLPVRGNNNVGTEKVCSVFMFVDWDGILINGKKK